MTGRNGFVTLDLPHCLVMLRKDCQFWGLEARLYLCSLALMWNVNNISVSFGQKMWSVSGQPWPVNSLSERQKEKKPQQVQILKDQSRYWGRCSAEFSRELQRESFLSTKGCLCSAWKYQADRESYEEGFTGMKMLDSHCSPWTTTFPARLSSP